MGNFGKYYTRQSNNILMSKRKRLLLDEENELTVKVKEIEEIINEPLTIWTDDDEWIAYQSVADLPLEERRSLIVYSLLDCSVTKVAKLLCVDRKTIDNRIFEIKQKLKRC